MDISRGITGYFSGITPLSGGKDAFRQRDVANPETCGTIFHLTPENNADDVRNIRVSISEDTFFAVMQVEDDVVVPPAQTDTPPADEGLAPAKRSAKDEFLEWMNMTPEERLFLSMLQKRGLTKEEFEALPPEKQKQILEEIQQEIRLAESNKIAEEMEESTAPATIAVASTPHALIKKYGLMDIEPPELEQFI